MKILVSAPELTQPTYQTLEEFSMKKFKKIERFIKNHPSRETELRVSVHRSRDVFEMTCEVIADEHVVITTKDRDLRKLVNDCANQLKRKLTKQRDKKLDLSKFKKRVKNVKERLWGRFGVE